MCHRKGIRRATIGVRPSHAPTVEVWWPRERHAKGVRSGVVPQYDSIPSASVNIRQCRIIPASPSVLLALWYAREAGSMSRQFTSTSKASPLLAL